MVSHLPAVGHLSWHEKQKAGSKSVDEFEPRSTRALPIIHTCRIFFPIPLARRSTEDKLNEAFLDFCALGPFPRQGPVCMLGWVEVELLQELVWFGLCSTIGTVKVCEGNAIANARQLLVDGTILNLSNQVGNCLNDLSRWGVDLHWDPAAKALGRVTQLMRPCLQLLDDFLYLRCLIVLSDLIDQGNEWPRCCVVSQTRLFVHFPCLPFCSSFGLCI